MLYLLTVLNQTEVLVAEINLEDMMRSQFLNLEFIVELAGETIDEISRIEGRQGRWPKVEFMLHPIVFRLRCTFAFIFPFLKFSCCRPYKFNHD